MRYLARHHSYTAFDRYTSPYLRTLVQVCWVFQETKILAWGCFCSSPRIGDPMLGDLEWDWDSDFDVRMYGLRYRFTVRERQHGSLEQASKQDIHDIICLSAISHGSIYLSFHPTFHSRSPLTTFPSGATPKLRASYLSRLPRCRIRRRAVSHNRCSHVRALAEVTHHTSSLATAFPGLSTASLPSGRLSPHCPLSAMSYHRPPHLAHLFQFPSASASA